MTGTRPLWLAWIALLVLLAITATSSRFDLGGANIVISLAVAASKTALIMLVFMHLARREMLPRLVVLGIGVWLVILYGLSGADYFTR